MKVISKKAKAVYSLIVMALICACMLMLPMPKTNIANAAAADNLVIKTAQIVVQKDQASDAKEWATLFKAQIDLTSYNSLTNNGEANVKLGMLVGPTKRMGGVSSYETALEQGFVAFSHVGTASAVSADAEDTCVQVINFGDAQTFDYYAGIVYDDAKLTGVDLKQVAALELSAIPFYVVDGTATAIVANAKSAAPKTVLVEAYALEQAGAVDNIPADAVNKYVGATTYNAGENYICQSTNRIMGSEEVFGGDLEAQSYVATGDTVFFGQTQISTDGALDTAKIAALTASDTQRALAVYHADGSVDAYPAKVATKVITRFMSNDGASTEEDYLADAANSNKTIFYMASASEKAIDGLYVLANSLVPMKNVSIKSNDGYTGGYTSVANKGFVGTLDGRGKTIEFVGDYKISLVSGSAFFPSIYGATIKNVAFSNINQASTGGGGSLASGVMHSTFENVYVKIRNDVWDFRTHWNNGLLFGAMNSAKNVFKNMIVDCDLVDYDYYDTKLATQTQYQTLGASGDRGFGAAIKGLWSTGAYTGSGGNTSFDNFFAVGSNPAVLTSNVASYSSTPSLSQLFYSVTNLANPGKNLYYNNGTSIVECPIYVTVDGKPGYGFFTLDQFAGTMEQNGGVDENSNDIPDYIEEIYKHAKYILECRFGRLEVAAQLEAGQVLKLHFSAQAGLYDMSNAQFTSFVKDEANADQLAKFDSKYWIVDAETGNITWSDFVHVHKYNQKVVAEEYLVKAATCTEDAIYYKSCKCGEVGTETFVAQGTALGHDCSNEDGTCTRCGVHETAVNLVYELNETEDAYVITGYKGELADVIVADTYNGLPVVAIAENAFKDCDSIVSLTISESITSIGANAFDGCSLDALNFTGTLAQWQAIAKADGWVANSEFIININGFNVPDINDGNSDDFDTGWLN